MANTTQRANDRDARSGDEEHAGHQEQQTREAESLDAKTTYEVIRREGVKELERTTSALAWSGLAAGLSMGFSFLGEALLHAHLPEARWTPLVSTFGYSTGFLIVILGSQQLFTENTLTPIIPLLSRRTMACLRNVLRLWGAVLLANLLGALLFAAMLAYFKVVSPEVQHALSSLARTALAHDFATTLLHGVYAGWLIALMVWMLPGAESAKLAVIIVMTYFVGLGGFAHVIAGASEAFYAAIRGEAAWGEAIGGFIVPALVGNILGGLTMVAALNHAQATSGEDDPGA
jgi:formate/nitrite transporter FocA (FNT family)